VDDVPALRCLRLERTTGHRCSAGTRSSRTAQWTRSREPIIIELSGMLWQVQNHAAIHENLSLAVMEPRSAFSSQDQPDLSSSSYAD